MTKKQNEEGSTNVSRNAGKRPREESDEKNSPRRSPRHLKSVISSWSGDDPLRRDQADLFCDVVKRFGCISKILTRKQQIGGMISVFEDAQLIELFYLLVDGCRAVLDNGYNELKTSRVSFFGHVFLAYEFFDKVDRLQLLDREMRKLENPTKDFKIRCSDLMANKGGWTAEEYAMLLVGINTYGLSSWTDINSDPTLHLAEKTITEKIAEFALEKEIDFYRSQNIDWRKYGFVSAPFGQGFCGCCWGVSPLLVFLSRLAIDRNIVGDMERFSCKQLVDCNIQQEEQEGCLGGFPKHAFHYMETHDMHMESNYPYDYQQVDGNFERGECLSHKLHTPEVYRIRKGFSGEVPEFYRIVNELCHGPVCITIDSSSLGDSYPTRIWDGGRKDRKEILHAVTLVAKYGKGDSMYFIAVDSRGKEGGIMRLSRKVVEGTEYLGYCDVNVLG